MSSWKGWNGAHWAMMFYLCCKCSTCEAETACGCPENTQFLAAIILDSEPLQNAKQTL